MSSLHVRVRVAGEDYALPVDDVLEIAECAEVAPVPGAASAVLGVQNLRGQVLPVVDLGRVFGLSGAAAPQRIVVAEAAGRAAGLAVESVVGVEPLPEAREESESPHLKGAALADGALVGLVDVAAVLDTVRGAAGADPELLGVFREEAGERLDRMVDMLLALESGQAPGDAVDSLFRDAHSIKGSAGMVGFDAAHALAHTIEDQLEGAREADDFPRELIEPLLRATDALRHAVTGEDEGPEEPDEPAAVPEGPRSIRMSAEKVDRLLDAVGETVLHSRRLEHLLDHGGAEGARDEHVQGELGQGELLLDELQESVIQMRTLPLSSITASFPRAVRDLAVSLDKEVELEIRGAETQLDRVILDGIAESITHLLRNAVAHGVEPPAERRRAGKPPRGRIELRAEQRGGMVAIEVADDGRGVTDALLDEVGPDQTLADVVTRAGFSTATEVTDVAGRGVGLDAVREHVASLRGVLEVESQPGRGTVVTMLLPLSLALLRVLLLERGGQVFGVPLPSVEEVIAVQTTLTLGGRQAIEVRGRSLPLADLAHVLGATAPDLAAAPHAVIVAASGRRIAAVCDRIVAEQEVVVKSLGPLLSGVTGYLGAAIMRDGRVALILDPSFLAEPTALAAPPAAPAAASARPAPKVLVVDDQFTVRELQRSILEAAGYRQDTARDGREALAQATSDPEVELVVTDIDMPEMSGFELLESIRRDEARASLPVVVVTGRGAEEDRRRGAEAGADAYIVKEQFDQRALLDTVGRLLAR